MYRNIFFQTFPFCSTESNFLNTVVVARYISEISLKVAQRKELSRAEKFANVLV